MPTVTLRHRRPLLALMLLTIALAALPSARATHAEPLPALPLPDCFANGLPIDDTELCEGGNIGYIQGFPETAKFALGAVTLAISTRDVDFRNDTDRGPQTITFTMSGPGPIDDGYVTSAVERIWPQQLEDDIFVDVRAAGDMYWGGATGGKPFGPHPENPAYSLLTHEGAPCKNTDTSCTYRVNWDAYPTPAVMQPLIYRVCIDWDSNYVFDDPASAGASSCGTDPVNGCIAGGGTNCVTFATNPPPPPKAVAKATRIGSKQFEFDASESTDAGLIEDYHWVLQSPNIQHIHQKTFEHDFNADNLPKSTTTGFADLTVTDHYQRGAHTFVAYDFAAGVEGFLEITSFEIVDISNGVATLKAVVKNKDAAKKVFAAFLQAKRFPDAQIDATPTGTELQPGESVEFIVTTAVDTTDPIFLDVQALGSIDTGPVKSKNAVQVIGTPPGPGGADTNVSGAGNAGDDHLNVGDTSAFHSGDYAGIDPGPNQEVRHVKSVSTSKSFARAGSPGTLVFDVPLAHAHAVGAGVYKIDAPDDDTTGPGITVTSPLAAQAVCSGAPLVAQFTCSDNGAAGVEKCGDGITSGQALDVSAFGAHQATLRAWDYNGNVTEKAITWTVSFCDAAIDAFHCYQSKPGGGTKFAVIPGVRIAAGVDDLVVDVKKPLVLCAPADTANDGIANAAGHLEGYAVKAQKGQPKLLPQSGLKLASQIGTLTVDTGKLASLLLPTAQDDVSPPQPLSNPDLDRFACYQAKFAKGQPKLAKDLQVTVADELTSPPKRFTLQKLQSVCVPATADGGATKHPDHLLCFGAKPTKGLCAQASQANAGGGCKKETDCGGTKGQTTYCGVQQKFGKVAGLLVANQLAARTLDAAKDTVVCLPSVRVP